MFRAALLTVLFRQTVVLLFFAWVCFPLAALAQGEQDSVLGWQGTPMRLDVACFFPLAGQPISGTVEISETEAWKKWQKEGKSPTCHVCVTLSKEAVTNPAEAAWHSEPLTIQTGPIAFSVPAGTLAPGTYLLSVWAMSPDGKDCRKVSNRWNDYNDTLDLSPTLRLMVRAAGSVNPAYSVSLHTTSALLTKARSLGSPNRERFPKDDEGDCYARGVRCLCAFDDRLFIGCGDGNANRGPIDIFTYVPAADGVHDGTFAKEFTVDEEAIDCFRAWGDNLYVPGTDAKEDWAFGNLYVRRAGQWSKERTIPRGLHVFDCARLGETLYVGVGGIGSREKETGRLWRSFDDGKTWTHCGQDRPTVEEIATLRFYALAPFAGGVLVFDAFAKQGPLLWRSKELTRQDCPLFGGIHRAAPLCPDAPGTICGRRALYRNCCRSRQTGASAFISPERFGARGCGCDALPGRGAVAFVYR